MPTVATPLPGVTPLSLGLQRILALFVLLLCGIRACLLLREARRVLGTLSMSVRVIAQKKANVLFWFFLRCLDSKEIQATASQFSPG